MKKQPVRNKKKKKGVKTMAFFDTVKGQNMMEHITITLDEIYEKKKKIEKQNDVLIEQNKEIISLLKKNS